MNRAENSLLAGKLIWLLLTLAFVRPSSAQLNGFNIKGDLTVDPSEVKVVGSLPFAAMMFKGMIEQGVRDELVKVLA